ncbi:tomoregulin-2 isoform X3 [Prionailurus viverrinus]|uniref:Tomoregulin-2 isoform X3 n=1 Tax=Acinonyx jubatus TaxID=32536 RepID=A0ABM3PIE8_ACIJB|nr:tomoregulin-2 isoform X3 [Felis catus]XP_047728889.1 tomoregulin-2 isoform X3 [Prionailurus viverrinus]XP_053071445.1 tomoregulin-2 isoform X3 [Acinonyx jubatus]XP_060478492.1 tomoregulin-2 isoform X3 [Panthera onca]
MVLWESPRQCSSWTLCEGFCWLLLLPVMLLIVARPVKLAAFPTSLSDCQTPTGWNCSGYDDRENDLFLCDTNTCKFDGECLRIGDTVTCVCQFKCNSDYVPVCGSNGESYQNECYLRQAACKQQSEILVVSEGSCATDAGSGSGDGVHEGSGETSQKETSTCDICQFGAECDEDAEDVWCVCNIDCSQTNFNPLCASDGKSYDNACQIKEASCQKQEKIEVMSLGRCQDNTTTTTKSEDGHYARTDYADLTGTGLTEESEGPSKDKEYENANKLEESAREHHIPCPEHYNGFCMHGKCEHSINMQEPSCRCDAGYTGQHCEKKDYSVLYVVPGPVRFQYVLIAAVIGTIQIAVICVVVLCITRTFKIQNC